MRVLVTGAAGFLGSHLCDRLIAEGHQVIGMDNYITGRPENLEHLEREASFSFIEQDVSEYMDIPGAIGWFLDFKLLRRKNISGFGPRLFDKIIPLVAFLEKIFPPFFGLSLFCVARVKEPV